MQSTDVLGHFVNWLSGRPYQRRKVRGGELTLPSEGRSAIY